MKHETISGQHTADYSGRTVEHKLRAWSSEERGAPCCEFSVGGLDTGSSGNSSTIHANCNSSEAQRTWLFASGLPKEHAHVIVLRIE